MSPKSSNYGMKKKMNTPYDILTKKSTTVCAVFRPHSFEVKSESEENINPGGNHQKLEQSTFHNF